MACRTACTRCGLLSRRAANGPVVSLDMTRQLCEITLDGVLARQVAAGQAAEQAVAAALLAGAGILASEQFGLAERAWRSRSPT